MSCILVCCDGYNRLKWPHLSSYNSRISVQEDDTNNIEPLKTALVIPCTIPDVIFNLPLAFTSIVNSDNLPDETILVFGIKTDLRTTLEETYPGDDFRLGRYQILVFLRKFLYRDRDVEVLDKVLMEYTDLTVRLTEIFDIPDFLGAFQAGFDSMQMNSIPRKFVDNIKRLNRDLPSYQFLGELIPKFKIILNICDHPYANSNRELGSLEAFGGGSTEDVKDNQIVSFVDCDDGIAPTRVHMIEQAFTENPEAKEVVHGFHTLDLLDLKSSEAFFKHWNLILGKKHLDADLLKRQESLYRLFFPFRRAVWKSHLYRLQELIWFQDNVINESLVNSDPRDLSLGNSPDGEFSWFLGMDDARSFDFDTKRNMYDMKPHNGHSSWRRRWLLEQMVPFPNAAKGEDARLNLLNVQRGGKILMVPAPLTVYHLPIGSFKRDLLTVLRDRTLNVADYIRPKSSYISRYNNFRYDHFNAVEVDGLPVTISRDGVETALYDSSHDKETVEYSLLIDS